MPNYFEILGIPPTAKPEEIRTAYKIAALKWHPDRNKENEAEATQKFQEIQRAYEYLSNEDTLEQYYKSVTSGAAIPDHPPGTAFATSRHNPGDSKPSSDAAPDSVAFPISTVHVFIPLLIEKDLGLYDKRIPFDEAPILRYSHLDKYTFEDIAKALNFSLEDNEFKQVGLDPKEAEEVLDQDRDWRRFTAGYIIIELAVPTAWIDSRIAQSEKYLWNSHTPFLRLNLEKTPQKVEGTIPPNNKDKKPELIQISAGQIIGISTGVAGLRKGPIRSTTNALARQETDTPSLPISASSQKPKQLNAPNHPSSVDTRDTKKTSSTALTLQTISSHQMKIVGKGESAIQFRKDFMHESDFKAILNSYQSTNTLNIINPSLMRKLKKLTGEVNVKQIEYIIRHDKRDNNENNRRIAIFNGWNDNTPLKKGQDKVIQKLGYYFRTGMFLEEEKSPDKPSAILSLSDKSPASAARLLTTG